MTGQLPCIAFTMPGSGEWIVVLVIGLLIFGRRLPEVARNLGKTVNEFKKGMREFQDSADEVVRDVNKIKDDVVRETEEATADVDEYDPYGTGEVAGEYDYYDSYGTEEDPSEPAEPSEPSLPETGKAPAQQDGENSAEAGDAPPEANDGGIPPDQEETDSFVEPMK